MYHCMHGGGDPSDSTSRQAFMHAACCARMHMHRRSGSDRIVSLLPTPPPPARAGFLLAREDKMAGDYALAISLRHLYISLNLLSASWLQSTAPYHSYCVGAHICDPIPRARFVVDASRRHRVAMACTSIEQPHPTPDTPVK